MTCQECGRPMRKVGSPRIPGTVLANGTRCHSCCNHTRRGDREPVRMRSCERCGVERVSGGNTAVLCRDCRSVLTREEATLWEA